MKGIRPVVSEHTLEGLKVAVGAEVAIASYRIHDGKRNHPKDDACYTFKTADQDRVQVWLHPEELFF